MKCFFFCLYDYILMYIFFYFQLARTNRNIAVWWKWWNFVNLKIFAGTVVCLVKSHNALKTKCITFPSYLRINTVSRVIVYCIIFWSDKCAFIIMRRIHILLQFTTICILDKCSRYQNAATTYQQKINWIFFLQNTKARCFHIKICCCFSSINAFNLFVFHWYAAKNIYSRYGIIFIALFYFDEL